jgi:hypothetical protein
MPNSALPATGIAAWDMVAGWARILSTAPRLTATAEIDNLPLRLLAITELVTSKVIIDNQNRYFFPVRGEHR